MNWKITDRDLYVNGENTITFQYRINEVVEADGILIVLLDVPSKEIMTENVFGVSENAQLLWQIERIPETSSDPVNVYVGITCLKDKTAKVFNWGATNVVIDVHTGKVLEREATR